MVLICGCLIHSLCWNLGIPCTSRPSALANYFVFLFENFFPSVLSFFFLDISLIQTLGKFLILLPPNTFYWNFNFHNPILISSSSHLFSGPPFTASCTYFYSPSLPIHFWKLLRSSISYIISLYYEASSPPPFIFIFFFFNARGFFSNVWCSMSFHI